MLQYATAGTSMRGLAFPLAEEGATMTKQAMIGVGVSIGALALGGMLYRTLERERQRRVAQEHAERVATWEEEGGALLESPRSAGRGEGGTDSSFPRPSHCAERR